MSGQPIKTVKHSTVRCASKTLLFDFLGNKNKDKKVKPPAHVVQKVLIYLYSP
jgi:hypothetical protein